MQTVEETLTTHLAPNSAQSWKARPMLPSKPCRITSSLVWKAYIATGQAATTLHFMGVLQATRRQILSLSWMKGKASLLRLLRSSGGLQIWRLELPNIQLEQWEGPLQVWCKLSATFGTLSQTSKKKTFLLGRSHFERWPIWTFSHHSGGKVSGCEQSDTFRGSFRTAPGRQNVNHLWSIHAHPLYTVIGRFSIVNHRLWHPLRRIRS